MLAYVINAGTVVRQFMRLVMRVTGEIRWYRDITPLFILEYGQGFSFFEKKRNHIANYGKISTLLIRKGEDKMGIYEELQARGLIAQVTDEERIRDLVNNGKATFYIGFDPTADSLHVGHFMAL